MNNKYKTNKSPIMDNTLINTSSLNEIIKKYFKDESVDEKKLNLVNISTGAYGNIFTIINNDKKYILKKPIDDDKETEISSEAEYKISSLISAFQHKYFKGNIAKIAPKIYAIYNDKDSNMKNIIMEKLEGDVFDICQNINVNVENDTNLLIELLYQTASHLNLLQKHFCFMHNDLKQNNILYKLKKKINLYLIIILYLF